MLGEGDKKAGLGKARGSFEDIAKQEGFAVGVTEEWKETKFCEGREMEETSIRTDSGEGRMAPW